MKLRIRELQSRCGSISPSILNSRIKDLREAGILDRTLDGYCLTERGEELRKILIPMGDWSLKWAEEVFDFHKDICR